MSFPAKKNAFDSQQGISAGKVKTGVTPTCPACETRSKVIRSHRISNELRQVWAACPNPKCQCTFKLFLSVCEIQEPPLFKSKDLTLMENTNMTIIEVANNFIADNQTLEKPSLIQKLARLLADKFNYDIRMTELVAAKQVAKAEGEYCNFAIDMERSESNCLAIRTHDGQLKFISLHQIKQLTD